MTREVIRPSDVGAPVSVYSHAIRVQEGGLLFVAGQVAVDEDGRMVGEGDCAAQTRQVFLNLERVLAAGGAGLGDVVKFTTYLVNARDIEAYRSVRADLFQHVYPDADYPTHTLLVVERLAAPEYLVEVEAIAALP